MNWIQCLSKAIWYIEGHLTEDINMDDVSGQSCSSSSHFQLIFRLVTGMTVGEYIRNRRLYLAALDLLRADSKVIDVAMRYQYDTPEGFSKAFTRFHGVPPSRIRHGSVRRFLPLSVSISVQGGFQMSQRFVDDFHWSSLVGQDQGQLSDAEKYKEIASWAAKARRQNPEVFDALTEWILDDGQWGDEKLIENEQILMQGVLARFKEQNAKLRAYLRELEPSGVVNVAVFKALDRFDDELSGVSHSNDGRLREAVRRVFADFSSMRERDVRALFAGNKTGPAGVDYVDLYGHVNYLKDCDAAVQWALFMPDWASKQQEGFKVDSFIYRKEPAMRFIGQEVEGRDGPCDLARLFSVLDSMDDQRSGLDHDVLFMHHYGLCVDVGAPHYFWGRFMKADAPVPDGFQSFDFVPEMGGEAGPPFCSQFAYVTFQGDNDAMHRREGYDVDAMYDVTRNIMLGQGVSIPYPDKYWTAEVFPSGHEKPSTIYMFSAGL